jgi:hypothetical protein
MATLAFDKLRPGSVAIPGSMPIGQKYRDALGVVAPEDSAA